MITARSFKYHRPRGLVSAAGHDANNLFQIGAEPNQRGDQIQARDGLELPRREHASVAWHATVRRPWACCRDSCPSASTTRRFSGSAAFPGSND